jgi:hypothetical protein
MDPNVCLQNFVTAYEDGDLDAAKEYHQNLASWLAKGGFEPDWNIDPHMWYTTSAPYLCKPLDI